MRCLWQAEIDPQARAVLRRHWPDADLYEDVRNVGASNLAPVDLVCGGFPCQDLSVAGRRAGLAGSRSGLWHEFHRILREVAPRWVLIRERAWPAFLEWRTGPIGCPRRAGGARVLGGPTGCLTFDTSERPSAGAASSLSDILEPHVQSKFFLSPRACRGILRRAKKRGKTLPTSLRRALLMRAREQAASPARTEPAADTSSPEA